MSQFAKIFEAVKNQTRDAGETPDKDQISPIKTSSQKPLSQKRETSLSPVASSDKTIPGKSRKETAGSRSPANQNKYNKVLPAATTTSGSAKNLSTAKNNSSADAVAKHKVIGKSRHPDYTQVLAYIRKDTHRAIKKILIDDPLGRDLSDLAEELFAGWLKQAQNG